MVDIFKLKIGDVVVAAELFCLKIAGQFCL